MRKSDLKRFARSLIPVILFMGMLAALGPPVKAEPTITENTEGNQYGTPVDGQFGGVVGSESSSWMITVPAEVRFQVSNTAATNLEADLPIKGSLLVTEADRNKALRVRVRDAGSCDRGFYMTGTGSTDSGKKIEYTVETAAGRQIANNLYAAIWPADTENLNETLKLRLTGVLQKGSFTGTLTFESELS